MAFKLFDRVQETSTSTGTGDITLAGAVTGFSTFSSRYSTGDTLYYGIHAVDANGTPTGAWEIGLGTYSGANTLTRTTVLSSSNSDAAVTFGAGSKRVFVTMTALQGASVREKLTADRTYYVATTGSDTANNGRTVGAPFLTIQKAVDVVAATLDLGGYAITVQVADGTYTSPTSAKALVGGNLITIQGNATTPANVVISTTSNHCFYSSVPDITFYIKNLKVQTTTSGYGLYADIKSVIQFDGVNFGACASGHIISLGGASVSALAASYAISGGAPSHINVQNGGSVFMYNNTATITGTPAFSTAFLYSAVSGIYAGGNNTWSGSATGSRYSINLNSVVNTNGAGTSHFPGNAAGTTATGGQYA